MGWLLRSIRTDCRESTKRVLALAAGATLCGSYAAVTGAVVWTAIRTHDVGTGLLAAFLGAGATLATLAGVAYRKPEPPPTTPTPQELT